MILYSFINIEILLLIQESWNLSGTKCHLLVTINILFIYFRLIRPLNHLFYRGLCPKYFRFDIYFRNNSSIPQNTEDPWFYRVGYSDLSNDLYSLMYEGLVTWLQVPLTEVCNWPNSDLLFVDIKNRICTEILSKTTWLHHLQLRLPKDMTLKT